MTATRKGAIISQETASLQDMESTIEVCEVPNQILMLISRNGARDAIGRGLKQRWVGDVRGRRELPPCLTSVIGRHSTSTSIFVPRLSGCTLLHLAPHLRILIVCRTFPFLPSSLRLDLYLSHKHYVSLFIIHPAAVLCAIHQSRIVPQI
jgi:hypothetical protein